MAFPTSVARKFRPASPGATFQRNVLDTNDITKASRFSSIVALTVTLLASISVSRGSDPVIAYFMFLTGAMVAATQHPKFKEIAQYPAWKLTNIGRPVLQSLLIALPMIFFMVLSFRWGTTGGTAVQKAADVFVFAAIGAFVEEYIRWVWLQTLPYSVFTANALWVFLHPQVARVFKGEAPNYFFLLFAFEFGLLMTAVMWLYESRVPGARGFGPMAAAAFHGIYNGIVLTFSVVVGGVDFGHF